MCAYVGVRVCVCVLHVRLCVCVCVRCGVCALVSSLFKHQFRMFRLGVSLATEVVSGCSVA